jgi:hypothetical protein
MNAFATTHTAESDASPSVQATREACRAASGDRLRKQEEDRVFEARLQWFLAVSAAA